MKKKFYITRMKKRRSRSIQALFLSCMETRAHVPRINTAFVHPVNDRPHATLPRPYRALFFNSAAGRLQSQTRDGPYSGCNVNFNWYLTDCNGCDERDTSFTIHYDGTSSFVY